MGARAFWTGLLCAALAANCAPSGGDDASGVEAGPPPTAQASAPPAQATDAGFDATPEADPGAPVPVLDALNPDHALVGSLGLRVVARGSSFVASSVIQVDGAPLPTTFTSDTELEATLPSSRLATAGTLRVAVGTAPPGGGLSAELTFTVQNPTPSLLQLTPASALVGAADTPLTVEGKSFVDGAKIAYDGAELATSFVNATRLTATIPAPRLTVAGSHQVSVKNPAPGGGASTNIAFTVTNPTVSIASVTPASAVLGAPATDVSLVGAGFVGASAVSFNGTGVSSTFVDGAHLTATIPASLLTTTGSFPIVVTNPQPGGGVSTPVTFVVQNPAPSITTLAPSSVVAGAAPSPITVSGAGFVPGSQITFDGAPASTTFVDSAHLTATPAAQSLAAATTIEVRVVTPMPGGGTSNALGFTVTNPAPTIAALSPSSAVVLSPQVSVAITGSGFVSGSVAKIGATSLATTYVSGTQLSAVVPSSMLGAVGTLLVAVTTPAPGGGTSGTAPFQVVCDPTGVDVQLGAIGTVTTRDLLWGSSPPTADRISSSSACPATISTTNVQPYRAFVVQNSSPAAVTLSTWAVCSSSASSESDAFLAIYRRSTVPQTDAERTQCTGSVSEGTNGTPSLASPEANGSLWCPGLTQSNGGGISLQVCEKAVVYVQPYSTTSATYVPPPQLRFEPQ